MGKAQKTLSSLEWEGLRTKHSPGLSHTLPQGSTCSLTGSVQGGWAGTSLFS